MVDRSYSTLLQYGKKWYYVHNGKVDFGYIGLVKYGNNLYYVNKGIVDFNYSGTAEFEGNEYIVSNGYATNQGTAIMGNTSTSIKQMVAYYNANAKYPEYYLNTDAPDIETFCKIYIEECQAEGVRTEVAFCQAMNETGFLKYGGQVKISQFNFAGIGATDDGASGATFPNVRIGIRAHVQHLKGYASKEDLNNECVDSRFSYLGKRRGSAPIVEWLGINENPSGVGWATTTNYGYNIRNLYMSKLYMY